MTVPLIVISLIAVYCATGTGLLGIAVVNAALSILSNATLRRFRYPGGNFHAPDWAAILSMITFVGAIALMILAALS